MRSLIVAISAILAVTVAGCGYTVPEGDKHQDVWDINRFVEPNPVVSMRRLSGVDEAVVDFYWPMGGRNGFAITRTKADSVPRVETLRMFDETGGQKSIRIPTPNFGQSLYVDDNGSVYFDRLRFDPPDFRPRAIGCVNFQEAGENIDFGERYRGCTIVTYANLGEFLRGIDSVIFVASSNGWEFWYRAKDGTVARLREETLGHDYDANTEFYAAIKSYLRVERSSYEDPPFLVKVDEAIVGNEPGGNHMVMYFTPKTVDYYRAQVAGRIWRFKLGSERAWGRIKAYETPHGAKFMQVYQSQYRGGYDSALYLVSAPDSSVKTELGTSESNDARCHSCARAWRAVRKGWDELLDRASNRQ